MPERGEYHVFISHGHADHIVRLCFFEPLHSPFWTMHIYVAEWLAGLPGHLLVVGVFLLPFEQLKGKALLHVVKNGDKFSIGKAKVESFVTVHPGGCLGWRWWMLLTAGKTTGRAGATQHERSGWTPLRRPG